jgi:hypothetical protein
MPLKPCSTCGWMCNDTEMVCNMCGQSTGFAARVEPPSTAENAARNSSLTRQATGSQAHAERARDMSMGLEAPPLPLNVPPPPVERRRAIGVVLHSAADRPFAAELTTHLRMLQRNRLVELWTPDEIPPGEDFESLLFRKAQAADILLPLLSADFLASDFFWEVMLWAKEHAKWTVSVLLKACDWDWSGMPLGHTLIPRSRVPVSSFPQRDVAWKEVATTLRETLLPPASVPPASHGFPGAAWPSASGPLFGAAPLAPWRVGSVPAVRQPQPQEKLPAPGATSRAIAAPPVGSPPRLPPALSLPHALRGIRFDAAPALSCPQSIIERARQALGAQTITIVGPRGLAAMSLAAMIFNENNGAIWIDQSAATQLLVWAFHHDQDACLQSWASSLHSAPSIVVINDFGYRDPSVEGTIWAHTRLLQARCASGLQTVVVTELPWSGFHYFYGRAVADLVFGGVVVDLRNKENA